MPRAPRHQLTHEGEFEAARADRLVAVAIAAELDRVAGTDFQDFHRMDGAGLGPPVGGSAIAVPRETVSFDLVDTKGRPARHGVVDEKSDVDVMEIIGPIKTAARAASRIAVSSNIWSVPDLQVGSRLIVTCPAYPIPLRMADRIVLLPDPLARDLAGFPEELLFRVDQARRRTDARLAKARLSD